MAFIKMYVFKTGLSFFLITICVVKSDNINNETQCNDYYKDMKNNTINITHYCKNQSCLIKCCGDGEILNYLGKCVKSKKIKRNKYSNVTIYSWQGSAPKKSNKNLIKDFVFIQNEKFTSDDCEFDDVLDEFYILEDGSMKTVNHNPYFPWLDTKRWDYCVDFQFFAYRTDNGTIIKELLFLSRQRAEPDSYSDIKNNFVAIALLTSCFFLLLVLAVYCLLRRLRNIGGMMLMAYVSSLFFCFLLKAFMILNISNMTPEDCKKISPILYYAILSSFFWLTIMSFDVWRTVTTNRKRRDSREILILFGWYCLYAWGTSLGITIATVCLDNTNLTAWPSILKPPFDSCFVDELSVFYYVQVPMATVSFVNIILFIRTAYFMWLVKRGMHNCQNSQKNKKEKNRFIICIKLAVMMGVSWCLELIPVTPLWLFIIINFYNMFMGVAIFFLFVFKKHILIDLCTRFNIKIYFVQNQSSRTETTRTTRASNFTSSVSHAQESTF